MSQQRIKIGTHVAWQWGQGLAEGVVKKICPEPATITTKGKTIRRVGTKEDPALIIMSNKGVQVIKLTHEVQRTNANS